MSTETQDMLLHGQLQEGLCYELMKASAVSGAQNYKELLEYDPSVKIATDLQVEVLLLQPTEDDAAHL